MSFEFVLDLLLKPTIPLEVFLALVAATGGIVCVFAIASSINDAVVNARNQRNIEAHQAQLKNVDDLKYMFAAAMINADGIVKPEELTVAEAIGKKLFEKFSPSVFRKIVNDRANIRNPKQFAKEVNEILTREGKEQLLQFLQLIAIADGEFHQKEQKLLSNIAKLWNIPVPDPPEDDGIDFRDMAYALAACIITADGIVESSEVDTACAIGEHLVNGFDGEDLKNICDNPDQVPEPGKLASLIKELLTDEGKVAIIQYLSAIASSTDDDNPKGWDAVSVIAETWEISLAD
jgi:uncharacterized tellurite resistance protein B-like protein